MALPPGSRFGEGRSGESDEGDTDSVRFCGPAKRTPATGSLLRSGHTPLKAPAVAVTAAISDVAPAY